MKKFWKDKIVFITIQLFVAAFVSFLLHVLNLNTYTIGFIAFTYLAASALILLYEFVKKKEFYDNVVWNLQRLDKKYLLFEMLDKPSFLEGEILYETLRQTSKSMNDEIAAFRQSSEDYREFIETWVHEIKTPIAAARLIALNHPGEAVSAMDTELSKIDGFVEQALFYSRSNTLEKDYIIKEINLSDLVKKSVKKYSKSLIESKFSIEFDNLETTVYSDGKWLDFILGQLISNAVKYRGQKPKLRFYADCMENRIVLTVFDNGIGIDEKDLKRVFDKGFTGENGRKYTKSTGLGLYLCQKLCSKMGLGIAVSSEIGQWTKVQIIFPKSKMEALEP